MSTLWLAVGVAVALSPAILGTVAHVAEEPWKAPSLFVLAILVLAVRAHRVHHASFAPRAAVWMIVAVLLQLVAAAVGWNLGHRLALGLGTIGFLRTTGWASLPTSLWVLPALPPPSALASMTSPWLETALSRVAVVAIPGAVPIPSLQREDGGLMPMLLGALFALATSRRAGRTMHRQILAGVLGAAAGLIAQVVGLGIAGAISTPAGSSVARWVLDLGPGLLIGVLGVILLTAADATSTRPAPITTPRGSSGVPS